MAVKNKIVFLHIPRTGGSAFRKHVLSQLYNKSVYYDASHGEVQEYKRDYSKAYSEAIRKGIPPQETPLVLDTKLRSNFKWKGAWRSVITGHFLIGKYAHLKRPFVVFFRDPVDRLISHYYWARDRFGNVGVDLKEFAERYPNYMSYIIDDDLSKIAFVGITERYEESVKKFSQWSGLKRVRNIPRVWVGKYKPEDISEEDRKFIAEINKKDYELYNEALGRFEKQ